MGKSKVRTLLVGCVMIMLSAVMIVGGSYALWSDSVNVNTHLSAGTLEVTLTRTYLEKYTLGEDMYMATATDSTEVEDVENLFGMEEGELIVPTSSYAARLKLTNAGDVAIDYTIKVKTNSETSGEELAKQVKIYIGTGSVGSVVYEEGKFFATEEDGVVSYTEFEIGRGVMDATVTETEFWVKIVFEDLPENNEAKEQDLYFDLLIEATQKTTADVA